MGCHCLLQGIFPTQGLKPGLLYFRWSPPFQVGSLLTTTREALYWFIVPQNIWGGLQEYFHCNKNIYELKFGTWRGKYVGVPRAPSYWLVGWLHMGLLTFNITYTLFQVSSLYHQPDLTVSIAAAMDILNSHELLICSLNLLRPQLFLSLEPPQATNDRWVIHTPRCITSMIHCGMSPIYSAWISERTS